jgi:hypothetical protein
MSDITTDFITVTKKIVAEVRGVLTTLHVIREDVKIIRDQVVADSDKQSADQQANNPNAKQADGTPLGAPTETNKRGGQKGDSQQKGESGLRGFVQRVKRSARKPKFWIELVALAGLVVYTAKPIGRTI